MKKIDYDLLRKLFYIIIFLIGIVSMLMKWNRSENNKKFHDPVLDFKYNGIDTRQAD